jgi:hypothetical protein
VITPSLPTFFIASAIILPTVLSPLAEIVPTWPISFGGLTFLARRSMSLTTAAVARSMPRVHRVHAGGDQLEALPS